MNAPELWRVTVTTTLEAEDAVADFLAGHLGAAASSYYNLERQTSLVSVYLTQTARPAPGLRREIRAGLARLAACGLATAPGKISIVPVRQEDWAESWKRHFKPLEVGRSLLIKPSWSRRAPKSGQAVVILDPGLSFGTGQHPTTAFCLGEIAALAAGPDAFGATRSFLDIGTGSGILAIAAAKLNFQPVVAFDFDPESVRVARENLATNQVGKNILLTQDDVTKCSLRPKRRFDLVCANLMANLLLAESERIIAQLNQGGTLVLAGILHAEFPLVSAAFAAHGLALVKTAIQGEWQSGSFRFEKKD